MEPVLVTMLLGIFLAAAGWLWWRRARAIEAREQRRRKRKKRVAKPKLPIVLAHGMFGFDEMELRGRRYEYFRGVPAQLAKTGAKVHVAKLSPVGSVAARAAQLAEHVAALDAPRVNLVAHSMGGIDARYAISKLGLSSRVASLTTIGAPHRGTPLADAGNAMLGKKLGKMLRMDGVGDITSAKMKAFNRDVKDAGGVAYFSHVGALSGLVPRNLHPLLVPGFLFLREQAGVNDGVVPSDSQAWGEVLGDVDADHWAQIGWSKRFDAPDFYVGLIRELRSRGF